MSTEALERAWAASEIGRAPLGVGIMMVNAIRVANGGRIRPAFEGLSRHWRTPCGNLSSGEARYRSALDRINAGELARPEWFT